MTLKDKIVIVTGSSSGIGQATAIRFAEEGAKVVINYRDNEEGGKQTLERVKQLSDGLLVKADLSTPDGVKKLFTEVMNEYSHIDILVNNAAIGTDKVPFMDASYDDMHEMLDACLTSVFMCSQAAAKIMRKHGQGKILNTSSIRGWQYGGRAPVYAACKAAVNSFSSTFAKELAPIIQVNAVAPGFVKTRTYDTMSQERIDGFMEQTRLKRWVTTEEIADAFIFLAKNDAMTGQVIYVEAGYMLR
jgi:3-oxoacyl-[acyl-carrier protein] reductase